MRLIVLTYSLLTVIDCAPNFGLARTIRYDFEPIAEAIKGASQAYHLFFETDNGISREEIGGLVEGKEDEGLVVIGINSYIDPDGNNHTVQYRADKDGFQPQGEDLVPSAGVKRAKPKPRISSACLASCTG